MAKTTKAQEVSTGTADSYTEHELSDENPPVQVTRAMLGRVDQSPEKTDGLDSSPSSEKTQQSDGPNKQESPQPVPNAENLSSPEEESSTVRSTDGNGQESGQTEETATYDEWSYAELQAECKDRDLLATGKKEDLIARLVDYDNELVTDDEDEGSI
jgi:hypothetical protein